MRSSGVIKWAPSIFSVLLISPLHPSQNHHPHPVFLLLFCFWSPTRVTPLNPEPLAASFSCYDPDATVCRRVLSTLFEVHLMESDVVSCVREPPPLLPPTEVSSMMSADFSVVGQVWPETGGSYSILGGKISCW